MIGPDFQKSGLYIFLIAATCVYYLLNAPYLLGHYDLGWHLAAGDIIRALRQIPLHDPWSFTAANKQWLNLSWLWDVGASALFQVAGFGGLVLAVLACGAIIVAYLTSLCRSSGASALAVCIAVLSAGLLYPAFANFPNIYLTASPNAATMLFAVMFYAEGLKRTKPIFWLPVAMVFWANLHGGFVLGLFILGVFGGVALLRRDWTGSKLYALAGAGCFAATFINPLGWHIYQGVTATMGSFVQAEITEWWPYYRNVTIPGSIPAIAYILIFVVLELRQRGFCPLEARLLSWLFLFLGLYQFRFMSFFFLFSSVPLALQLDRLSFGRLDDLWAGKAFLMAGAVAACALPLAYLKARPDFQLPQMLSKQDVAYLETHFPHARLLNHWNYGGLLIFYDRGAIPVFVDGRASTAYPDDLLRDYFRLTTWEIDKTAWDTALAKYRIDTVLWVKAHEPLRHFLVSERGWKVAYSGAYASLYIKP
ncbi:MAG TPA: hypothetical protein VN723_15580 [Rhizomicrobium sp.]|nr:hypothetical protein [Rhizomicrobium sp.]